MEDTISTICLDFYGLPGSGKSTISHKLADRLMNEYLVVEPSYELDHKDTKFWRAYSKFNAIIKLMLLYPRVFICIIKLIKKCDYKILSKDFILHLLNIGYKTYSLKRNHQDYIIFDQGLRQAVVSLYFGKDNKHSFAKTYDDIRSLVCNSVKVIDVYIKVDINTAINRMNNRNSNISRVQLLNETEKVSELEDQLRMMNSFENNKAFVFDSGVLTIDECVSGILERLNLINERC